AAAPARAEEHPVAVGEDREDAAGDGGARDVTVPGLAERLAEDVDLLGLEIAEGGAVRLGEQGGAHQVQTLRAGALGRGARARAPPDVADELLGLRLDRERGVR